MTAAIRGVLLDIEGTTSSIHFVHEVMFPFVRRELDAWLLAHWDSDALNSIRRQMAIDAGLNENAPWLQGNGAEARQQVRQEVLRLMDGDVKATGLKQLQGLIWEAGFQRGELLAQVYDDVPPALTRWNQAGLDVRIYSSGSVQAQHLFFAHTEAGNLLGQFRGHYDTRIGGKKEAASYTAIAASYRLPPGEILFVSDIVAELDAAAAAGMQTALSVRPGNGAVGEDCQHARIRSFAELPV